IPVGVAAIPGCNSYWNPSAGRENPLYNDVSSSSPAYRLGGHWRVRNITVGYTLPAGLVSRFRLSPLRVYAQAQDPFVFTSYSSRSFRHSRLQLLLESQRGSREPAVQRRQFLIAGVPAGRALAGA